ncbi:GNAT family N-acetyltransferase [Autumnicola musiva]|uniref:GNAT family N-acetyltransferase n=1 Tax=Autumnicola musiva TaxID=3075589 RepID=A0ABU3D7G8_9FLAO|nr:GNAT family N-acetyltransferase [Zunongwangia sp. F117]MDT0677468.1 GNAT family N-acetyltransferase [Zunongwangia sp. F117]
MTIRKAAPSDIPAIISVLKISLGEDQLAVSEEVWNFKHEDNPFGKSIVFVAEENEKIIGVRAFMRWNWKNENQVYKACRAVDTATHPEHRGKGIFKKLTLKAVEAAREEGVNFIFNTPNEQSRPGYLKMGWETAGKIKVGLFPAWNSFWRLRKNQQGFSIDKNLSPKDLDSLCKEWNNRLARTSGLYTPKSPDYLRWRYEINPLQNYEVYNGAGIYMAAIVKYRKNFKELRIVECIFGDGNSNPKDVKKLIKKWSLKFGVHVISFSPELMKINGPSISGSFGPILTIRNLNTEFPNMPEISDVQKWTYSLGDLELF